MSSTVVRVASDLDRARVVMFRREVLRLLQARMGPSVVSVGDDVVDGQTITATQEGRLVASVDLHLGSVGPLPADRCRALGVTEVVGSAPEASVAVLDEPVVHPDHHDGDVEMRMLARAVNAAARQGARWIFTTCVAQDLPAHRAMGFVPCGAPISGVAVAFAIPVVIDLSAGSRLRSLGSPFVGDAAIWRGQAAVQVEATASSAMEAVKDPAVRAEEAARVVRDARSNHHAFLSAIDEALRGDLLLGAKTLRPALGERMVSQGDVGRDLYLILKGIVEVRRGGHRLATLGPGDLIGEVAFLMEVRRSADVVAATPDVVALKIGHERLTSLAERDPRTAAAIWLGIARALASKLAAPDR